MAVSAQIESFERFLHSNSAKAGRFYAQLPHDLLRKILLGLLLIWLLWGAVQLLWAVFPGESVNKVPARPIVLGAAGAASSAAAQSATTVDAKLVSDWTLFGSGGIEPQAPAQVINTSDLSDAESNAEETRLQLTLNGLIESDTEENSRAVITYQGKQDQYAIGDKLPVRGRVTMRRLLADRVLIENSGKLEALYLFDKRKAAANARVASTPRPATPSSVNRSSIGSNVRQKLLDNPSSLMDLIRISEARENGELIGYRLRPSRDKAVFEKLGLKANDVVTSVDGLPMTNVTNGMRAFQTLRTASEATFEIIRDGVSVSQVVSIDDVNSDT